MVPAVYQWCGFQSRRGKNKNLTALKSNSNTADTNTTQTGYVALRLKSSLQSFYCGHHNLVDRYGISISQMTMDHLLFK